MVVENTIYGYEYQTTIMLIKDTTEKKVMNNTEHYRPKLVKYTMTKSSGTISKPQVLVRLIGGTINGSIIVIPHLK